MYYWNKVIMVHCQVMKRVQWISTHIKLCDSIEQKHVHLSNSLILSFEIHYTFRVWICSSHCGFILWECHACPLFYGGLQLQFAIFLVSWRACCNFKIWIHGVMWLDKRDMAYKVQAYCLMYALTRLHEIFHPQW